ncbi:hypothetical protein GW932_01185 [archaeon]|nr:hypothetical protein [archaeon]
MKSKQGAMEMSVGTIVTIVLLMSVLVLGLFLVKNIFSSAKGAVDLTDQQLTKEIQKLFSEDSKVVIYPTTRYVEIKAGKSEDVAIGIKNTGKTSSSATSFSYTVTAGENDCGISPQEQLSWIRLGKEKTNIPIAIGDTEGLRVRLQIPEGTPLCLASFDVTVQAGGSSYDRDYFDIQVTA